MLNSITIKFENCENAYKSKKSKINLKKYIKKLLEYQKNEDYLDILYNHQNDIRKYFNIIIQLHFKITENDLVIFAKKLNQRDINIIKLNNKIKNLNNKKSILAEKKEVEKKINDEKKLLNKDSRIYPLMKDLYYKVKSEMPNNSIPNPSEILNNIEKFKKLFQTYIDNANKKNDLERYILLKNNYCIYMSFMTHIIVNIPSDLEKRYKTNNMKF